MAVILPSAASAPSRSTFPEEPHLPIRNQSDVAAIEAVSLSERALPESSYAALVDASKRSPDARALSFFLSADRLDEAHVWTYAELVADVTRAANLFAALGVAAERPVAYVLPNLPETHFAIWGGEAAGAALAVNPLLQPKQVLDILRFARASVLVTLAPALNPKAWSGLADELASLPDLSAIAFVDMADYLDGEKRGAARASIEEAATDSQLKGRQFARSDARAAFRPARPAANDSSRRHILLLLHRRNDGGAEDCSADASKRGVRLLGRFKGDGD